MPRVVPQVVLNDDRQVKKVRVVAQTMGSTSPKTSENHWSIFFLISDTWSVRSNMATLEHGNPTGELQWESQNYTLTNSEFAISQPCFMGLIAINTRCQGEALVVGGGKYPPPLLTG